MATVSIRITSKESQVSLEEMISCNRYVMCTEGYMVFNCTEENLFSGFMQVVQVYSNRAHKSEMIPPACVPAELPSPQPLLVIRALACHHILTLPSEQQQCSANFVMPIKVTRLLNANCSSISVLQKPLNLQVSPHYSQFFYFSCPRSAEVSSLVSVIHPSGWPLPTPK